MSKTYYLINYFNRNIKEIPEKRAILEQSLHDYIIWYEAENIVFIADEIDSTEAVEKAIKNKLSELGMEYDRECFLGYEEEIMRENFKRYNALAAQC